MLYKLLWLEWKFSLVTFLKYKLIIYHRVNVLIFTDDTKLVLTRHADKLAVRYYTICIASGSQNTQHFALD
jgi:hypothetical protein